MISAHGRIIVYDSLASNLVASDAGDVADIFWRDNGPLLGDLNGDGLIDTVDRDILDFNWGVCPCCAADLNADGVVDEDDLDILEDNATD